MPISTLSTEEWSTELREPLPFQVKEVESSRTEEREPDLNHDVVVTKMPPGWGPGLVHSFLQHIHKDPTGEGKRFPALTASKHEVEILRRELKEMKARMDLLEAALGLRPPKFSSILQVAQETEYTWVSEGYRITIVQERVKVTEK